MRSGQKEVEVIPTATGDARSVPVSLGTMGDADRSLDLSSKLVRSLPTGIHSTCGFPFAGGLITTR